MALRKYADGSGPDAGLRCLVANPPHGVHDRQPNVQTLKSRPIVRSGAAGLYLALPSDPDFVALLMVFLGVQINRNHRYGDDWARSSATHDEWEIDQHGPRRLSAQSGADLVQPTRSSTVKSQRPWRPRTTLPADRPQRSWLTGRRHTSCYSCTRLRADPVPDRGSSLTAAGPSGSSVSAGIGAMLRLTICMNRAGRRGHGMHDNGREETAADRVAQAPEHRLRSRLRAQFRRPHDHPPRVRRAPICGANARR